MKEFAITLGLLSKAIDDEDEKSNKEPIGGVSIVDKIFNKITMTNLFTVFNNPFDATDEEKAKLANLCILSKPILPFQLIVCCDPFHFQIADNADHFVKHPWGLESFSSLLVTMKKQRNISKGKVQGYDARLFHSRSVIMCLLNNTFAVRERACKKN